MVVGWFDVVWWLVATIVAGVTQRAGAGFFVAGMLAVWALVRGGRRWEAAVLAALAVTCTAHGMVSIRSCERDRRAFIAAMPPATRVEVRGRVVSFPSTGRYGTSFRFAARIDGGRRIVMRVRARRFDIHPGDSLLVRVRAVATSRSAHADFADGYVGTVSARAGDIHHLGHGRWRGGPGWWVHRHARIAIARRLGNRGALPLALLLGERGTVAPPVRDAFARLGVAHLLALSGLHLGLVAGFVWFILRAVRVPRSLAGPVVAVALIAYVAVVGEIHSLSRALVMALVLLTARLVQRPVDAAAALGRALFVLLVARPATIYSLGFQLSVVATFAVVTAIRRMPPRDRRGRRRRAVARALTTVLAGTAAVLVTMPLQLAHFDRAGMLGPLATVVLLPVVAAALATAALAVSAQALPLVGDAAFAVLGALTRATEAVVLTAARHGPPPVDIDAPHTAVYAAGLAAVLLGRRRMVVAAGVLLMVAAFAKSCGI